MAPFTRFETPVVTIYGIALAERIKKQHFTSNHLPKATTAPEISAAALAALKSVKHFRRIKTHT
jgi:hypothetical protein